MEVLRVPKSPLKVLTNVIPKHYTKIFISLFIQINYLRFE